MKRFAFFVLLAIFTTAAKPPRKHRSYLEFDNPYGTDCDEVVCESTPFELTYCIEYDTHDVVEVHGICMAAKAICWSNKKAPAKIVPMKVCDKGVPAD
ncbi:hypothetical protein QE152_g25780 [Popillia japonica]|uniref:Uncharacterized protein n=1 Tax=Popillia japonica TaxID=7064 RepID=A0AAW1K1J7_POPJA